MAKSGDPHTTAACGNGARDGRLGPAARRQWLRGDDALVAMFNRIRDELVSTLLYLLGNADDAQDAAQEAFLKCWRARHSSGPTCRTCGPGSSASASTPPRTSSASAWNRKSRPLPEDELMMPRDGDDTAGRSLEDQEALDRLRLAITQLRQDEKEVFLLRQNGELTYEQIAEIRNAPVGTVKTQIAARRSSSARC